MTLRRTAKFGGIALGAILAIAVVALASLWIVQRGQTLPNTVVAGIDVGGLSAEQVADRLTPLAEDRESAEITFTFEGEEYVLVPTDVGYEVDVDATVTAALERGRTGLPGDIVERVRSLRTPQQVTLVDGYDSDAARAWVDDLADELDREARTGSVTVDPATLAVDVEMPSPYVEVARDEVLTDLVRGLASGQAETFEVTADSAPQQIPDEDVIAVAATVERAVSQPLELVSGDASVTLQPRDIARLVEVQEVTTNDGLTLAMVVVPSLVDDVMGEVARGRFERDPVDAGFTRDRVPPVGFDAQGTASFQPVEATVEIVDGRDGTRFDPDLAAEQLTILLRDGARTADLRLDTIEPALSNQRARELQPTHLLGTFTTYYTAGESRSHNIQLLADTIDGAVVMPGEQFSINEISGARTCDKGYLEAGTIIRGELVPTCGGGTSQFGTTTFNAAFFAGMQLDQWKAHSWYISRYPMGREATLSYPELDVKFTNTTSGAVLVKTSHTASSVTVSVYGRPIASTVTATLGSPTNPTNFSTQRRQVSELAPGQERVVQAGIGGFTVDVVRTIELLDGSTEDETIRTVYVPQTRIVEHGPPARAPASPDD